MNSCLVFISCTNFISIKLFRVVLFFDTETKLALLARFSIAATKHHDQKGSKEGGVYLT